MVMQELVDNITGTYNEGCRYLRSAEWNFPAMHSNFSIPYTFYGYNSGHFNATEMMMCVNQMAYVFFAKAVQNGDIECAKTLSLENFLGSQMNCLLTGLDNIKFKAMINPREFSGDLVLTKSRRINGSVYVKNDFSFYDSNGGNASGEFKAVLSLIPRQE